MAKVKMQFSTKIEYEVRIIIPSADLTMTVDTFKQKKDAQDEARRLHRLDKQPYKVIKVTKECIYRIA